jgi:nitroreductase
VLLKRSHRFLSQKGTKWIFSQIIWNILPETGVKYAISKSKFLTTIFFYLRGTFYPEQKAILRGKVEYNYVERGDSPNNRLIKNTHQIEKGISMDDRRDVFGEGYINDLVEDIELAWNTENQDISSEQLRWSVDVLNQYFSIVDDTDIIAEARESFNKLLRDIEYKPDDQVPRKRSQIQQSPVSYEEFKRLAEQRSSTRWFQQKSVSREMIDDAIRVAAQSPSACNRQSFEYRVYDDQDILDQILQPPLGISGFKDNIPCLIVLTGKQRAYRRDQEKNVVFVDASLSAMTFQYTLESMGLASCTINWPAIPSEHKRMQRIIDLDDDEIIITLIAVGYPDPDGMIPFSKKRDLGQLRSYNRK